MKTTTTPSTPLLTRILRFAGRAGAPIGLVTLVAVLSQWAGAKIIPSEHSFHVVTLTLQTLMGFMCLGVVTLWVAFVVVLLNLFWNWGVKIWKETK